jgi:opacity protein-like surface antigen
MEQAAPPNQSLRLKALIGLLFLCLGVHAQDAFAWRAWVDLETAAGYDDNVNQEEDKEKRDVAFLALAPSLAVDVDLGETLTAGGGYQLGLTRYITSGDDNLFRHEAWGQLTALLSPGLFATFLGRIETLQNDEDPEDDGWGFLASPRVTYHVNERVSLEAAFNYSRWKYDDRTFDTGRAIIFLDESQIDHRYEVEGGLIWLLWPNVSLNGLYRYTQNHSTNEIDEYDIHHIFLGLKARWARSIQTEIGYHLSQWDYSNWRAGKQLRGKLREDTRNQLWAAVSYDLWKHTEVFLRFERTVNHSNLHYESFDRNVMWGGIRIHWQKSNL